MPVPGFSGAAGQPPVFVFRPRAWPRGLKTKHSIDMAAFFNYTEIGFFRKPSIVKQHLKCLNIKEARMLKFFAKPFAICLITAFVLVPLGNEALAAGKEPSAGAMIADTFFARPLGLASTIVGSGVFIVSIPFSALGENASTAFQKLVKDPFVFTFSRPLGDF
jgi:hypothetical protein